jgi:hypothetical protein
MNVGTRRVCGTPRGIIQARHLHVALGTVLLMIWVRILDGSISD